MSKIGDWIQRTKTFLGEVKSEWGKVTSPNRQEVIATTVVVVVTSFIFAGFLWMADSVILWAYNSLFAVIDKVT